ncbi:hypothetical protein MJG53_007783 [Ovis ammon polii x Ovis aries]|uniref:Uncharacterized protein n=2 Tax=Ovis TaxID=9935 RepID=A0A836D5Y3_SHEEP|nr:hypothetical protein JEQ12_017035 [Ovis aries]KAI4570041.1 hypothetical protein MJT46_007335 [Ovis ammon polii x Ovis aries]KAI4584504.1 hypothetical protein MJG53_007783 [Ovis ammon polii x Ovis aries]
MKPPGTAPRLPESSFLPVYVQRLGNSTLDTAVTDTAPGLLLRSRCWERDKLREPAESRRNPRWQPSHIFSPYSDVIERQCRTLSLRFYYISQDALPTTTLLAGADGRAPD